MLTANSTNTLLHYFTDAEGNAVEPGSTTVTITRPDASTETISPVFGDDDSGVRRATLVATPDVFPAAGSYRLEWDYTIDGVDYQDVSYVDVSELDLGETDIVSLAEVCEFIADAGSVEVDVAAVQRQLYAAAAAARDYTNRLWSEKVDETRVYPCCDLTLYPDECRSVTSVKGADGADLNHTVMPGLRPGDHVRWIEFNTAPGRVDVTGSFGWDTYPPNLVQAVCLTAAEWYRRAMTARLGDGMGGGQEFGLAAIPPVARGLLDDLAR